MGGRGKGNTYKNRKRRARQLVSRVKTTGTGRMPGSWPWQSRSVRRLLQSKTVREEGVVGGKRGGGGQRDI